MRTTRTRIGIAITIFASVLSVSLLFVILPLDLVQAQQKKEEVPLRGDTSYMPVIEKDFGVVLICFSS